MYPLLSATLLLFLSTLCFSSAAPVRCFIAQFPPRVATPEDTSYTYDIDIIAPLPLELTLDGLEFGPSTVDGCTWAGGIDALQLFMNGALAAFWEVHCSDPSTLVFSISNLGTTRWSSSPLTPAQNNARLQPVNGRIDFLSGEWAPSQAPSRYREITLALYSKGTRAFMPSYPAAEAPLTVKVCVPDAAVPHDIDWRYHELPAPEWPRVWPYASCVYEERGKCGANLAYCASADVQLERHSTDNRLSPAWVENGWTLPTAFFAGCRDANIRPHMHVGWDCEMDGEVHWVVNGSMVQLNRISQRCPNSPLYSDTEAQLLAGIGADIDSVYLFQIVPQQHRSAVAPAKKKA